MKEGLVGSSEPRTCPRASHLRCYTTTEGFRHRAPGKAALTPAGQKGLEP